MRSHWEIDATRVQKRRNLAAVHRAIFAVPVGLQIGTASLTLAAPNPTITVAGFEAPPKSETPKFIDRTQVQRRRNLSAVYTATFSGPVAGASIAPPPGVLNVLGYAPLVIRATPILSGGDLQADLNPNELFQPARRNHLFALAQPGSNSVNVNLAQLTLTRFAPTISITGVVSISAGQLSLNSIAPTIVQQNAGRVDIQLSQLSLNSIAPSVTIAGPGIVNVATTLGMTLTGYGPVITQFAIRTPRHRTVFIRKHT